MNVNRFFSIVAASTIGAFLIVLSYVVFFTEPTPDLCDHHQELFEDSITAGIVVDKYVDTVNHAIKTVKISANKKIYTILFIPYENWRDFDSIEVNDIIDKPSDSFGFRANDRYTFVLNYECHYNIDSLEMKN